MSSKGVAMPRKSTGSRATHRCVQAEHIAKINELLVGNHEPENGVIYKMLKTIDSIADIKKNIDDIKGSILNINEQHSNTIAAVKTTASALEKYKSETEKYEAGKEAVRVQKNLTTTRIIQIITMCIALFMAYLGYKNLVKKGDATIKRVDDMGTPVIINNRGMPTTLPKGDALKFYPKDFTGDTINK